MTALSLACPEQRMRNDNHCVEATLMLQPATQDLFPCFVLSRVFFNISPKLFYDYSFFSKIFSRLFLSFDFFFIFQENYICQFVFLVQASLFIPGLFCGQNYVPANYNELLTHPSSNLFTQSSSILS